jgi:D-glycero-alpha-D-manno-heptose 1-phosphate guanylyltransferase
MEKTAIVLAGGLGTRLRSVVQDRPKPMALVNNKPFLAHQLDYWIAEGIEKFILSVGYKHDVIIDFFGHEYKGVSIDYSIETKPMGTGGGLLLAIEKSGINTPFLLLNGDTYFKVNLDSLISFSEQNQADLTFSLFPTTDLDRYMGIDVSAEGQVVALKSQNISKSNRLASGGVYWINNLAFLQKAHKDLNEPSSFEDDILPTMLSSRQKLFGFICDETFIDIGLPDDYYRSESILSEQNQSSYETSIEQSGS